MGDAVYTECAVVETLKHDSSHLWPDFIGVGQHRGGDGLKSHTLLDLQANWRTWRLRILRLKAGNTNLIFGFDHLPLDTKSFENYSKLHHCFSTSLLHLREIPRETL